VCPSYRDNSISIELIALSGDHLLVSPGCTDTFSTAIGGISAKSGVIHWNLGDCGDPLGLGHNIVLGDNVVIPPGLPDCGQIVVWEGYRDGICEWIGAAVLEVEEPAPAFIVANSRNVRGVPFVAVGLQEVDVCLDEGECPGLPPGLHGLVFGANPPLAVDDVQSMVLEFLEGPTYRIANLMSWVDTACDEHVAWQATLQ